MTRSPMTVSRVRAPDTAPHRQRFDRAHDSIKAAVRASGIRNYR
jgi:hypothetical protein